MPEQSLNRNEVTAIAPGFRLQWEEAQECHVILYPEGMVKLSVSAGEIMNQVDGSRSVDEIIDLLSSRFKGADLGPDVIAFLSTALAKGWLRRVSSE